MKLASYYDTELTLINITSPLYTNYIGGPLHGQGARTESTQTLSALRGLHIILGNDRSVFECFNSEFDVSTI